MPKKAKKKTTKKSTKKKSSKQQEKRLYQTSPSTKEYITKKEATKLGFPWAD